MLLCQELSGREHRALHAGASGSGCGYKSDRCFSCANISLQEAQHRFARRKIRQDCVDRRCLINRPRRRQCGPSLAPETSTDGRLNRGAITL